MVHSLSLTFILLGYIYRGVQHKAYCHSIGAYIEDILYTTYSHVIRMHMGNISANCGVLRLSGRPGSPDKLNHPGISVLL